MCTDLLPKSSNGLNHPKASHLGHLEVYLEGQASYGTPLYVCLATLASYQNVLRSTIFHNALALHKGWGRQRCTSADMRKAPFSTLSSFLKPLFLRRFHGPIKPATNQTLAHLPPLLIGHFAQCIYKPWKQILGFSHLNSFLLDFFSLCFLTTRLKPAPGLLHFLRALPFCSKGPTGSLSDCQCSRADETLTVCHGRMQPKLSPRSPKL